MTLVWDSGAYEGGTLLVLLALADWAQDDGCKVFPKMETLAQKARLSVRGAQMCVATLRQDGVIEEVAPARRGRATEYKIVLHTLKELHRKDCTAITSGEAGNANGVQSATVGVQSVASHIDNHQEPPLEPSYASARESWAKVWAAFKTWPGLPAGASEQRARTVWERMAAELPADLVARVKAHGAALARDNAARGKAGHALVIHPHNWLERDRGWEAYGPEGDPAVAEEIDPSVWEGEASRLVAAVGPGVFRAWFGEAAFVAGPPVVITLPKRFQAKWVANNYGPLLQRLYGEDLEIKVAA